MVRNRYWFAPKVFGVGSGMPISWEGWAVLIGFLLLLVADIVLLPLLWRSVVGVFLVAALFVICARTTEGGWRWRS